MSIINFNTLSGGGEVVNFPTEEVVLTDGEQYSVSADTLVKSVTYNRTFSTNQVPWILPCDMEITEEMLEVVNFSSLDFSNTKIFPVDYGSSKLDFDSIHTPSLKAGDVLKANTPYIIQGKAAGSFVFKTSAPYVKLHKYWGEFSPNKASYIANNGLYSACFMPAQFTKTQIMAKDYNVNIFYMSNSKLLRATGYFNINSYRWIMYLKPNF